MLLTTFLIYTNLSWNTNYISLYDIQELYFYNKKLIYDNKPQIICKNDYVLCPWKTVKEMSCINLSYGKKNKDVIWECSGTNLKIH